jgi:hypothetical protein
MHIAFLLRKMDEAYCICRVLTVSELPNHKVAFCPYNRWLIKNYFGDFYHSICIVTACMGQVFHERKYFKRARQTFQHALKV